MGSTKKTVRYIIVLLILLALMAILSASIGAAKISVKETSLIIASYIPGLSFLRTRFN